MAEMVDSENGTFAVEWLLALARDEGLFFNPRSEGENIKAIMERFMPGSTLEGVYDLDDRPDTHRFDFAYTTAQRDIFFNVYVNALETWLDVSESRRRWLMPTTTSKRKPSAILKADSYWSQFWEAGVITLQEAERRALGSLRLRDAYYSDPLYAKKASRDPSFWSKFYATRVNS